MKFFSTILIVGLFGHGLQLFAGFSTGAKNLSFVDFEDLSYSGNVLKIKDRSGVKYGDFKMEADSIDFNKDSKQILLQGNVLVTGEGLQFKTTFIDYNLKTQEGSTGEITGQWVSDGNPVSRRSEVFEHKHENKTFYLKAKSAQLKTNSFGKPSFYLSKVRVTDCDKHNHPHHQLDFGEVVYSSNEKIELRHLVLRLFGLPYFYWPYAVKDIEHDWPWTRWEIGSEADWGRYALFQTQFMPKTFKERLKLGLDYRMRRGRAYHLFYEKSEEDVQQDMKLNLYDERWEDQGGDLHFEDQRFQLDYYHKQKLSDAWSVRLDGHFRSSTEEFLWSGPGNTKIKSRNRYTPPVAGAKQLREGVLEEYDELTYREGALQEQELALEYWEGYHYLQIKSVFGSDDEQVLQREKWIELDGQTTPTPLFGENMLYSSDYRVGRVGQRLGRDVSSADLVTVLGSNPVRNRFHTTRAFLDQTLEAQVLQSNYLQLTPFVGSRSLIYEKVLKKPFQGQGFWETQESELEKSAHSHRIKSGFELASRLTGDLSKGSYQHIIRPSFRFTYLSPTGLDMDQVVAPVDQIDLEKLGQLENIYSLNQEVYVRRQGKLEPLYLNQLSWRQILDDEDQTEIFGTNEREAEDLWMSQSYYPIKNWSLSLDSSLNTFHGQFPTLRAGLHYGNDKFKASYHWNKLKDLTLNSSLVVQRHDLEMFYQNDKNDFKLGISWDEDPQQNLIIRDSLYEEGFRRFEFIWGHMFHCLRSELELGYDFEGGGSSVIFRFGPGIFNDNLPETRFPLK